MIWSGQIKAIVGIVVFIGLIISFVIYSATDGVWPFFVLLVLIVAASLGMGILNTLSTAFTGKPFVYDVKVFDERRSAPNASVATGNPFGVPPSSPSGFCTNGGRPRSVGARFCTNCGAEHISAADI
ncbi:MAG: zinc ribbon domain-containing protein [Bryobacteraceae bacterium]|jgi:hypothetical protein